MSTGLIVFICIVCVFVIGTILIIISAVKTSRKKQRIKADTHQGTQAAVKKSGGGKTFLAVIGALAIIVVAVLLIMRFCDSSTNKDNPDGTLLTRSVRNSDISFEEGTDITITLSEVLYFTPYVDINDLQITLYFLDSNRQTLTSQIKEVGDVREGSRYSVDYSLFDLGLGTVFNCQYLSWTVTGGTVSYFA